MTHQCHLAIIQALLCHDSQKILHNIYLAKKFSTSSVFYFFFFQQSTALWLFFPQFWNPPLKWVFLLLLFSLPQQSAALWPFFHNSCTFPWITCSCFAFFLRFLVMEPSLLDMFPVSCVHLIMFSMTNRFLSWGLCMPYLICSHFKILSKVYIILVGGQIHAPSYHLYLYRIFSWFPWNLN